MALLTHYTAHISRLGPTRDRYKSVLQLAGYLADPDSEAGELDWPPGGQEALRAQLTALLRRPGWPPHLEELLSWPDGNTSEWARYRAEPLGLLPTVP